ncbi:MAG: alkaline phosphatase, partial [Anaerolineae bacterium]|nr:alkaline phosphatase [Anaerolineae bacterium]
AGHEHSYERILTDDIVYFVNGLGGRPRIDAFARTAVPGSTVRYNQNYGALLITADATCLNFTFYNRSAELIDSYTVNGER